MKRMLLTCAIVLFASSAFAQTPIFIGPISQLQWNVLVPDAPTAQSLTYAIKVDGATTATTLTGVTCASTSVVGTQLCSVPIAQLPVGSHSITMTAAAGTIVSAASALFAYVDLLVPTPFNFSVKQ